MHTSQVAQDADDKLTFDLLNPLQFPIGYGMIRMHERHGSSQLAAIEVIEAEAMALLPMTPLGAWLKVHGGRYDLNGQTIFGYGGPLSITFRDPNAAMHFKLKWV